MARLPYVLPCLLLAACKFGDDRPLGGEVDASVDGANVLPSHLLITEIMSDGSGDIEFIEIWNPSNADVNLSNYFLSDFGNYWQYPAPGALAVVPTDFLVGFPSGAVIASNQVIVVAFRPTTFVTRYSPKVPDYGIELTADAGGVRHFPTRLVPNVPPDGPRPSITDSGEYVTLFYWDRSSDLVKDVDIVLAGVSTGTGNALQTKTMVDGPDMDTTQTRYKVDMGTFGGGMTASAGNGKSYKRTLLENGRERQAGDGNGITGDDETTEPLKITWDNAAGDPTPGTLPTSLSP